MTKLKSFYNFIIKENKKEIDKELPSELWTQEIMNEKNKIETTPDDYELNDIYSGVENENDDENE